jgi:hypothetical protein
MSSVRFPAVIVEGKPRIEAWSRAAFMAHTSQFIDGEEVWVTVTRRGSDATDQQRRFYRGVIVPIIAHWMGEPDENDAHNAIAFKFLRIEDHPITGAPRRKSTSRRAMTVPEFAEYLEKVMAYFTVEHGLLFPAPEKDPAKREKRGRAA